jgi:hypothetical protein
MYKNLFIIIFLSFSYGSAFANEITGYGEYKIGMEVREFLSLDEIKKLYVKEKQNCGVMCEPGPGEMWRTTNGDGLDPFDRVYSDDVVKYEFKIAVGLGNSGVEYKSAIAKFYKNKLASLFIVMVPSEFREILTVKYGEPKTIDETKTVSCQNGYGARTEGRQGTVHYIWNQKGPVSADFSLFTYDCVKVVPSYTVKSVDVSSMIDKIYEDGKKALKAEELRLKANSSKL